ncbi:MAG: aminoglycoside 3'-phosphotransferase [Caldilineaceae bacterium]|nr:aminoglycoside 3'-phosphotransferase [Caldilineaceae bacterium]
MMLPPRRAPPATLAAEIAGYTWEPIQRGCSGAAVYRLTQPGAPIRFLKVGPTGMIADERDRLTWLAIHLPVPEVYHFLDEDGQGYLLMSAIAGLDAIHETHGDDLPNLVRVLAEGLRLFHATPMDNCPFDEMIGAKLGRARQRAAAGLVDPDDFDEQRLGKSVAEVLAELEGTRPPTEDLVLTHGDYCLPNILLDGGKLSGFIDLGRAGVADRFQDLALAARSLAYNFGEEWVPLLFEHYGIAPDPHKMAYFQLLDEFF